MDRFEKEYDVLASERNKESATIESESFEWDEHLN